MKQDKYLPDQEEGVKKDFERDCVLADADTARSFFELVADRLRSVNEWNKYTGMLSARFTLTDKTGLEQHRLAEAGDYVRISLPGPSLSIDHYDWVQVHQLHRDHNEERDEDSISLQLTPSPSPDNASNDVAHFFSDRSSSNFVLLRQHRKITISYHGRNETPNLGISGIGNKLRNLTISIGSVLGLSDLQWTNLLEGLISPIPEQA